MKARPLNPGRRPIRQPFLETDVNKQGSIRITAIGPNGAVAQNLTLNSPEVDAVFAAVIRRGAGRNLVPLAEALAERGLVIASAPAPAAPAEQEMTVEEALNQAERVIFANEKNLHAFVDELGEENLMRILGVLGQPTPEAEPDEQDEEEDDERYFDRLAITITEDEDRKKLLLQALERHGFFEIQPITSAAKLGHILTERPEFQTDVTVQPDGTYQLAIRTNLTEENRDELLEEIQAHVRELGGKWKTRKGRGSSGRG